MSESYSWTLDFPTPPATGLGQQVPVLPAILVEDWGTDFALLDDGDLDATFRLEAGDRMFRLALARRLLTPRGFLDFHPDYGVDIRQFLNRRMDRAGLEELRVAVENELEKDERVARAEATVRFTAATQAIEITCTLETQRGPFELTMLVSPTTIQVY